VEGRIEEFRVALGIMFMVDTVDGIGGWFTSNVQKKE